MLDKYLVFISILLFYNFIISWPSYTLSAELSEISIQMQCSCPEQANFFGNPWPSWLGNLEIWTTTWLLFFGQVLSLPGIILIDIANSSELSEASKPPKL